MEPFVMQQTTWDGLPVAHERPFGAAVATWRMFDGSRRWLLLHRAVNGPGYEGDWAWTPPSGARMPGEGINECALRELAEEIGLAEKPTRTSLGSDEWALYVIEAPPDFVVTLDEEHDRFEWATVEEAVRRCLPASVGEAIARADAWIGDDSALRRSDGK